MAESVILVKTASEISLKTKFVEKYFLDKLVSSIKSSFRANEVGISVIERDRGRLYISVENSSKAFELVKNVFGIHSISLAKKFELKKPSEKDNSYLDCLSENILTEFSSDLLNAKTFAVRARNSEKKPLSPSELEKFFGAKVLEKFPHLKVNLSFPEKTLFIEFRKKGIYAFMDEFFGLGGLPLGCEGNVAVLFTGKKEDLLAAFLLMHRGAGIFPIIENATELDLEKLKKQINSLLKFNSFRAFLFAPLTELNSLIEKKDIEVNALVLGEKEFSKQSLELEQKISIPIFRPLMFYPKELLEEKEKLIGLA